MAATKLIPITDNLFFDGKDLIEDGNRITLGKRKLKGADMLRLLLENRGITVKYQDLYAYAFENKPTSSDPTQSVHDTMSRFLKRCPASLSHCIRNIPGVGYQLISQGTLQLKPQYVRGVTDGAGLFSPCAYHKNRPELEHLLLNAFSETNAFAICGGPGMGKTELARNFVHACCTGTNARLQYGFVLFTTFHKDGLRATLEQLPAESACSVSERYDLVLSALRTWGSSLLLVIDNADVAAEELGDSCPEYADLLSTGCHILFTSRRTLDHCPGLRCIQLQSMDTRQLKKLFREAAGPTWQDDDQLLDTLIETYLQKNTYLVLLAAGLMKSLSLETLVDDFSITGEISENTAVTKHYKDGRCQDSDTLMGHFQRLYHLHSLTDAQQKLLLLLAFLPIEGMDHASFFARAFPKAERAQAQRVFAQLTEQHWAFHRDRKVCLHPMVKELVLNQAPACAESNLSYFLQSLADHLSHTHFHASLLPELAIGCAAYDAALLRDRNTFEIARLTAQLASVYDTLTDRLNAYSYGKDAKSRLDLINPQTLTRQKRYQLADGYNVSAYAITHYQKGEYHTLAENALTRADQLLDQLLSQSEEPEERAQCQILKTKVAGNLGACYQIVGDYKAALAIHQENLAYRQALQKSCPEQYTPLAASAHKAVATAYFYLSRQNDRLENLQNSLSHHRQAVALYRQLGPQWQLELGIAINRFVGTGLQILALDPAQSESFVCEAAACLEEAMTCLCSIAPLESELRDCLVNTRRLLSLPAPTDAAVSAARRILNAAKTLPPTVLQTLAQALQELENALL